MWLSFTAKQFHLSRFLKFRAHIGREGKGREAPRVSDTEFAADSPTDPLGVQEPSAVAFPGKDTPFPT